MLTATAPGGPLLAASADPVAVVEAIDKIRARLADRRGSFHDPEFLLDLAERLAGEPVLAGDPAVRAFVEDCRDYGSEARLTRTKAFINLATGNTIFSLFDASYFRSLSLEYLRYRLLPADPALTLRYPSPTKPVVIEEATRGFDSRVVVALFPENHIDGIQTPEDSVFYFIDKFVERHFRLTRPLIREVMSPDSFPLLREAGERDAERASSWWVRLHEYHHRQGDMPIPEYLAAKSYKPLAGLEELRTDVSSMLACLNDARLPREDALLTYEYILAERLLRYAIEGIPRPNYDAVASQLLFNYLSEAGGLEFADGKLCVTPRMPEALTVFLGEIERIEAEIHREPVEQVRARLLDLTNRYTEFDEQYQDYRHIPFFAEVKQRLGV
ncbi:DUF6421 family protein [Catenulispora subtropica]|uniref:Uncharacterized protein n=1 Tax=Catenulispora subtropica TaxID=450798 RepID=A0ABN2S8N0_9ACTN